MNSQLRSKAIVSGIGATPFGVLPDEDAYTLGMQALTAALADAGLERHDIDALIVVRIPDYQRFSEGYGIDPKLAFALQGQGRMTGVAMELGASLIASGSARTVAIAYGNDGRSRGATYGGSADGYGSGNAALWSAYGMTSPGAVHAMMFAQHAHQYGTDPLALAEISVTFRHHASLNPQAVMRNPITVADHQNSRFIAEPLRLFDYCLINDGGVAVILSTADAAGDQPHPPVYVRAVDTQTRMVGSGFPPADYWRAPMQALARSTYANAGLAPDDMDALMIYDNFSPTVLFSLEGFGYCEPGESGAWVWEGNLRLGGRFPANTSGGHLSESYMQGWGLVVESVRQVRKSAGPRQVPNAHNVHYMCAAPVCSSIIFSDTP
ncbi:thiolase family protein [Paraburkholderia sp. RP-4-7]|uniref:Thiolase family protein n=1 Tax=Paraburkholderia polaris TaxID=2728848 RepID=A0A848IS60_9BURK|nr:thiolase family protein [Paraburkholderia polaris]NMM03896.1 thiolase family protein [Paraburkholderia polaris]